MEQRNEGSKHGMFPRDLLDAASKGDLATDNLQESPASLPMAGETRDAQRDDLPLAKQSRPSRGMTKDDFPFWQKVLSSQEMPDSPPDAEVDEEAKTTDWLNKLGEWSPEAAEMSSGRSIGSEDEEPETCTCYLCGCLSERERLQGESASKPEDAKDMSWWQDLGIAKLPRVSALDQKSVFKSLVRVAIYCIIKKCWHRLIEKDCRGCAMADPGQEYHDCLTWGSEVEMEKLKMVCESVCLEPVLSIVIMAGHKMEVLSFDYESFDMIFHVMESIKTSPNPFEELNNLVNHMTDKDYINYINCIIKNRTPESFFKSPY